MITDTHAHLFWESFKADLEEVLKRSAEAKVTGIINVGVDVNTSQIALDQLPSLPNLTAYSSIGIHPHEAVIYAENPEASIQIAIQELEKIYLSNPEKVVAVGECGLDYLIHANDIHPDIPLGIEETKALQRKLFQAQIELAKRLNLPLLIHCRDDRSQNPENCEAWDEVLELASSHFGVLHCYSGKSLTTQKALKTNFYFSFAGNLTYPKNEYLREAVKIIPLEKILVETDCPFLPPQTHRGMRNEPSFITAIVETIAQIKNEPITTVQKALSQNFQKLLARKQNTNTV
ncbi:MAG: TatD family hydrolase [Candidatus Daviesbacteria bacterium]|nr:TatD family hydrolase [Candidatus Daviesbacteria bacterium]